ncbi:MAG: glycosyltransferase [Bacteroidetes bacterium]|nr:glycosyltransferase [Bacteroidota bacterium]
MAGIPHILFLPSWYPTRVDPLNGIFNRELAQALSARCKISLLHLVFDPGIQKVEVVAEPLPNNGLAVVVYLPRFTGLSGFLRNQYLYLRQFFKQVHWLRSNRGEIQLSHVQVAWKLGLYAWLLRKRKGIPYIITEHYTGYLPADGELKGRKKDRSLKLLKEANAVTAVSPILADELINQGVPAVQVIPNLIHPDFFSVPIARNPREFFRFVHVSNARHRQKQTGVILQVFRDLILAGHRAELLLIIPDNAWREFEGQLHQADLSSIRHISPMASRQEFISHLVGSQCLVSFSRFETFGLTLAEAVCIGIPCIYTHCGGAETQFKPGMGILVDANDPDSLKNAMVQMLDSNAFQPEWIAPMAREIFAPGKVLDSYTQLYYKVIQSCAE